MKLHKHLLLTYICAGLIVCVSCRKTDHWPYRPAQASTEEKFFNAHRTDNPAEKVLVDFLKRKNNQLHFVETTVKRIGLPRWDKIITKIKPNSNSRSETTGPDSSIFYVPFVRESEDYVNAAMMIKVSASDTLFSYLSDWQYQDKTHGPVSVDTTAERYALFFMLMDNQTFGYNDFRLTDPGLFPQATQGNNDNRRLKFLNVSTSSNARAGLYQYTELCVDYYVCGNPDWCADHGGCDYLNCASPSGDPNHCYLVQAFCDGWWEDNESGGGGNTGIGSGTTGGGGTGTGNGMPPACPGTTMSRMPEGCNAGWQPYGPVQPQDPCIAVHNLARQMDSIFLKSKADSVLASIPNLAAETKEKGFGIVKKLRINPNNSADTLVAGYRCDAISTGNDSAVNFTWTLGILEYTAATLHTHPSIGYAAHSAKDIYNFLEGRVGEEAHFLGTFVAAANGSQYALSINNPAQATAFLATKSQYLDGSTWNEESEIGKAFKKAFKYFEDKYEGDANKKHRAYEMAMAVVLTQFNTGFTLNKKDASGNFKPIVVKTSQDPRRPRRTIYTQQCL